MKYTKVGWACFYFSKVCVWYSDIIQSFVVGCKSKSMYRHIVKKLNFVYFILLAGLTSPQIASGVFTLGTAAVLPFYTLMVVAPTAELVKLFFISNWWCICLVVWSIGICCESDVWTLSLKSEFQILFVFGQNAVSE